MLTVFFVVDVFVVILTRPIGGVSLRPSGIR
jgi:hypothetical protein